MSSFWKSWKTTLFGLGAGALNAAQGGTSWKNIGLSVALALIGAFAKDHNVTGGTISNGMTPVK